MLLFEALNIGTDDSDQTATYTYSSGGLPAGAYTVSVTLDSYSAGYGYMVLGGTTLGSPFNHMNSTQTYGPADVTIGSAGTIVFHAGVDTGVRGKADFRISGLSIKPNNNAATASAQVNLVAGVSYNISVPATTFSGSLSWQISGNSDCSKTCTSGVDCSKICTASTTGTSNLVFASPEAGNRFTTGSISVTPQQDVLNNTWASLVPVGDTTSDFYDAVIKTSTNVSPSGSSVTDFANGGGDSIALITSSYAPNKGATTFYDDFAVQLDMKSGVGFLPPIQQ